MDEKLEYLFFVNRRIRNALLAVEIKNTTGRAETQKLKKKPLFSELYKSLSNLDAEDDIEAVVKSGTVEVEKLQYMLDDYEFNLKPKIFWLEFKIVLLLYASQRFQGDVRLDLVVMRALFHAGCVVEALATHGVLNSDEQSRKSRVTAKGKVGYQAVWDAFFRVDCKGLRSVVKIGEEIKDYLVEIEKKKPENKKKEVYCGDYIGKTILPKDPDIKKILLREGILKS